MRREGFLKLKPDRSGGDGRFGVSGTGRGFEAGATFRLGCSFGSRSRRSGIAVAGDTLAFSMSAMLEGILLLKR